MRRFRLYYKDKHDQDDNLVLSTECSAETKEEAIVNTMRYLNKNCIITKIVEDIKEKK